MFEATLITEA